MPASSRSQSLTLWGSQDRATELAGMVREGKRRRKEEVEGSSITTADLILEAVELWKKRRGRRRRRKEEPAGASSATLSSRSRPPPCRFLLQLSTPSWELKSRVEREVGLLREDDAFRGEIECCLAEEEEFAMEALVFLLRLKAEEEEGARRRHARLDGAVVGRCAEASATPSATRTSSLPASEGLETASAAEAEAPSASAGARSAATAKAERGGPLSTPPAAAAKKDRFPKIYETERKEDSDKDSLEAAADAAKARRRKKGAKVSRKIPRKSSSIESSSSSSSSGSSSSSSGSSVVLTQVVDDEAIIAQGAERQVKSGHFARANSNNNRRSLASLQELENGIAKEDKAANRRKSTAPAAALLRRFEDKALQWNPWVPVHQEHIRRRRRRASVATTAAIAAC